MRPVSGAPPPAVLVSVRDADTAVAPVNPVALLLANKRSPATQRAYRADLRDFFGGEPSSTEVQEFISLPTVEIALRLNCYKAQLLSRGVAEATVNRRLAAVRALLKFCHRLGYSLSDGRGLVDSEKVRVYRDTRGVDVPTLQRLVAAPGTSSRAGLRDTAILRLLCENALRRAELCSLAVGDFSLPERRLLVLGKGRGTQKEPVTLSRATAEAIATYLQQAGHAGDPAASLFRNLDHRPDYRDQGLTVQGLYWLVGRYGAQVGVQGLTPHKLRHSAITAALDATGGDVRRVQRLSRHAKLETLQRYDDNRTDLQGEVTRTLAGLFGE